MIQGFCFGSCGNGKHARLERACNQHSLKLSFLLTAHDRHALHVMDSGGRSFWLNGNKRGQRTCIATHSTSFFLTDCRPACGKMPAMMQGLPLWLAADALGHRACHHPGSRASFLAHCRCMILNTLVLIMTLIQILIWIQSLSSALTQGLLCWRHSSGSPQLANLSCRERACHHH